MHQSERRDRNRIIQELRHQLRYAAPSDREAVRRELDFWIHHR